MEAVPLLHQRSRRVGSMRVVACGLACLAAVLVVAVMTQQQANRSVLDLPFDNTNSPWFFHGTGRLAVIAIDGATGQAIDGAQFEVHSADGVTVMRPDAVHGQFEIELYAPMVYHVVVTKDGYVTYGIQAQVNVDALTAERLVTVPDPEENSEYKAFIVLQWGNGVKTLNGILRTPRCEIDGDSPRHCVDPYVRVVYNSPIAHGPDVIGIKAFESGDFYYEVDGIPEQSPFDVDARVTLFVQGELPRQFVLGRDGYVHAPAWKVFRIFNDGSVGRFGAVANCRNEACAFGSSPLVDDRLEDDQWLEE